MKLGNKILVGLLVFAVGLVLWMYFNPRYEKVYVQIKPKAEIVFVEKEGGGNIATVEKTPSNDASEVLSKDYITYVNDTLVKALNKGLAYKVQVQNLTKINAQLKDSLSKKDVVINTVNKDVISWKTKYIEIESNVKDSTVKYRYNAQLDIVDYSKKTTLFGARKQYIAVSSPDKNLKINNVENFTKDIKTPKDFVELNLKAQGLYINKQIIPYGGAELLFNPDGRLKPIVGYGYFYDHISGKIYPYWMAGLQLNLIRF